MIGSFDIGDLCTHCGEDTSPGSGRWVNRIPSEITIGVEFDIWSRSIDVEVTGYLCPECQGATE